MRAEIPLVQVQVCDGHSRPLKHINNKFDSVVTLAGVNILQKEEDFVLGILGVLLGRIPGF